MSVLGTLRLIVEGLFWFPSKHLSPASVKDKAPPCIDQPHLMLPSFIHNDLLCPYCSCG